MRKMPTVFQRDHDDQARLTDAVHPDCQWVLDGEGTATRKYDGTCLFLDIGGRWLARREVKPGKTPPSDFAPVEHDPVTGKTVGYEPVEASGWAKWHADALDNLTSDGHTYGIDPVTALQPGTYELVGPKVNGNPDGYERHTLVRHTDAESLPHDGAPRTRDSIKALVLGLAADHGWEGVVYHHPDGRMAKIKARDFRREATE